MKFYKISEIAKTFNISRETLIYYDTINLFKPAYIDQENGYRYYNDENISDLYFISMLKKANFSLKEIKDYINCKNTSDSIELLNKKLQQIKDKISILQNSAEFISDKIQEIENISNQDGCTPFLETLNDVFVFQIEISEPKSEKELIEGIHTLNELRKKYSLEKAKRITILKKEDILKNEYFKIDRIGVIASSVSNHYIDFNLVVSIYHKDFTQKIGESYFKLLKFIDENNFKILGDSIETFNDVIVNAGNCMGQTIKISIPIES